MVQVKMRGMAALAVTCLLVTMTSSVVSGMGMRNVQEPRLQSVWRSNMARGDVKTNVSLSAYADTYIQCQKYACPPSKVVADKGSYKIVYFPAAPYAKVKVEGKPLEPAVLDAYTRLRSYITGNNKDKKTLPMTAPVILRVDPGQDGLWGPKNYTTFFYMDPKVTSPPAPTDPSVDILEVNAYTLYVRTFSGYAVTYADWMRELLQLMSDVEADGEKLFTKEFFYFASYDPPTQFTGRINEVQLLKDGV